MKRRIKLVLLIMWLVVIFLFSNQPAVRSTETSQGFITTVVKTISKDKSESNIKNIIKKIETPVRKTAHFSVYLILGILSLAYVSEFTKKSKKILLIALLICIIYAAFDEFHQYFIPGRSAEVFDVLIDTAGASMGILITYFIYNRKLKRVSTNKNQKGKKL